VNSFICEGFVVAEAKDIKPYVGWRAWLAA